MPRDIYSLKVSELKAELAKRGLPTRGNKASLLAELIEALTNEGFDPDTYEFPEAKELSDDSETEQSPEQAPTKTDKIMEMLSAMTSTMNQRLEQQTVSINSITSAMNQRFEEQSTSITASINQRLEEQTVSMNQRFEEQATKTTVITDQLAKIDSRFCEVREEIRKTEEGLNDKIEKVDKRTLQLKEEVDDRIKELTQRLEGIQQNGSVTIERAAVKSLKAPIFDEQIPWGVYKTQFEAAAIHNRWTDEERATALVLALKGPAAAILQTLPAEKQKHYGALIIALETVTAT